MAAFNKFQSWVDYMVEGVNLSSDQLRIALTAQANAPIATNSLLANLTEINYANITENRNVTTSSSSQAAGTYTLVLTDLTLNATGDVAAFRYVVLYDDTVANDPLIGWWDYGSEVTLHNGESFTIDFAASTLSLT